MPFFMKKNNGLAMLLTGLVLFSACQTEDGKTPQDEEKKPKIEKINLSSDFVVDHLYSPSENKVGSWVSMTFDGKGRMIVSDQYGSLYRLTIPGIGESDTLTMEPERLALPGDEWENDSTQTKIGMGYAQGLLWAHNSLYVMVNHWGDDKFNRGSGLYRLQDKDNDDQFEEVTLLKAFAGNGEHGPHSVVLGPDSTSIYIVAGNHTDVPADFDRYRLPTNWDEDNALQTILDPQGHATDRRAPGGWVAKTDSVGSDWELVSAGFRNAYDIAFNADGELFAYDSDMEWDFGMPWYRPTRMMHVTSGSEFGWRTGNGKWPTYYPDNLPALVNVGQGSPTNLLYAGNARFPEKYRNSLLAFDWSFGIVYSVQLERDGATYRAKTEEFLSGAPLPLTDGEIGPDGALYFLTGGRRLDSDLYRVYHKDHEKLDPSAARRGDGSITPEMALRRELEAYHVAAPDASIVEKVWPYLNHNDRHVRYAASIALAHQPVGLWVRRAFGETNVRTVANVMTVLAKQGHKELNSAILRKLMTIDIDKISRGNQIAVLRAIEVTLFRLGETDETTRTRLVAYLDGIYPATDNALNRELSKILVAAKAPSVVSKTLDILADAKDDETVIEETFVSSSDLIWRNPQYGLDIASTLAKTPPAQQIYFATALSKAEEGWTPELRERYFTWFHDAFGYKGGNSYVGFVDRARKLALEKVPEDRRDHYNTISGDSLLNQSGRALADLVDPPKGPGRAWKIDDALKVIEADEGERDFARGKSLFAAVRCGSCHVMQGEGGAAGPDLTQLGTRFSVRDMLAAIIDPNEVISDQYEAKIFHLRDGTSALGRLISENQDSYSISQNPYDPHNLREIPKSEVTEIGRSKVSIMPPGSLNMLNEDELKDLIAYLMAGGNEASPVYAKK